jgi:hypothetical protein
LHQYPRRREVRQMLTELHAALDSRLVEDDIGEFQFDLDFLTSIRDLMRDGLTFGDALVLMASPVYPPD